MNDDMHEGHRARIRASYRERGLDGMADHELLELLLTYVIPRKDVNELAHRLLQMYGSLADVLKASVPELMRFDGIGERAAVYLHLLFDTHRRLELQSMENASGVVRLTTPQDACRYALALSRGDVYETLRLISMDAAMTVLHTDVLGVGSLTKVTLEPRRLIEIALLNKARYIILTHNHPSGILVPSPDDIRTAEMIQSVAAKLEIDVRDQLILGQSAAYSFKYDRVFFFTAPTVCHSMTIEEFADIYTFPQSHPQSS